MMTDKRMGRGGATIRQRTGRALIGAAVVAAACAAIVLLSDVALLVPPLLLLLPVGGSRAAPTTDWRGWLSTCGKEIPLCLIARILIPILPLTLITALRARRRWRMRRG